MGLVREVRTGTFREERKGRKCHLLHIMMCVQLSCIEIDGRRMEKNGD